ncbi:carbohydrate ABC transporter permease [Cohnella abietis]|uniref:Sugar ABC transporter ATP-binding protein n=1 Tax=Cohnella abietis TaxID=2507935 RepID=A0A3T1D410_9BACL|nr:carbohydrate ABC transporter permease [Cohnella abietis]BBI32843.1 sugar ABC transporter ATP-binding protein [Cohnella abietis]
MRSIRRMTPGSWIGLLVMLVISIMAFYPFYSMLIMSTYQSNDLYTSIKLLPGNYLGENFKTLFSIDFLAYYKNSIIVAISTTVLGVLVSAAAGFAFGKYKFRFKNVLFVSVLLTMMIPMQFGIVAFVIEMRWFGWLDTLLPLIIPPAANAFGVFWMTQFARSTIPDEVMESARIDGCGETSIFFKIVLPFLRPAFITLGLLFFLWSWNSFFVPLIVLSTDSLYTIPLGIRGLAGQFRADSAAQILGLTIGTIPVLVFFAIFSKNLIEGLASSAVKG